MLTHSPPAGDPVGRAIAMPGAREVRSSKLRDHLRAGIAAGPMPTSPASSGGAAAGRAAQPPTVLPRIAASRS